MYRAYRNERGAILLLVTVFVASLAALGSAFMLVSIGNNRSTVQQAELARAGYIAEAGVDLALYDLAYGGRTFGDTWDVSDFTGGTLHVETVAQTDSGGSSVDLRGIVISRGTVGNVTSTVETTVYNDTATIHELFFKAIYAGNRWGLAGNFVKFTGVNHNGQDYMDRISGDIHVEGEIRLGGDASAHRFGQLDCTGPITKYDMMGQPANQIGGGFDDSITPPDLASQGYDRAAREYRSWDPAFQGTGRDVVNVGNEYAHYSTLGEMRTVRISSEHATYWNNSAQVPPDGAMANFFMTGYQDHFVNTYNATDDQRMAATNNYYLGARNGGTATQFGDTYGLYGGGHSVITINEEQNNKVYYVDGNLWVDSDGDNHVFFVPGPGVDRVNITIVAKGNVYVGDQVFVTTNTVNTDQYDRQIGGNTSAQAFRMTDPESGIALVAMRDGESYNDTNKNGKYDVGESIIGREDPGTAEPAANNPSGPGVYATGYQGRMEGSGNIIFGDTINGPVGVVEAFMFAENNFVDISSDTSTPDQNPYIFGNMTAGNSIFMNRYYPTWLSNSSWKSNSGKPSDWTYSRTISGRTYYFPPGTNASNYNNTMVTYRRMWKDGNTWRIQLAQHIPLDLTYDERIEDGVIALPGLPSSNRTVDGSWKILVWKQY